MGRARPIRWGHAARSRRPGRVAALLGALLLLAAACGGEQEADDDEEAADDERVVAIENATDGNAGEPAESDASSGSGEPESPEEPEEIEPPDEPSTDDTGSTTCRLPGRWRLRSDEFFEQLPNTQGAAIEHVDGTYDLILQDGGDVRMERIDWSLRTSTPDGSIRITISDLETGSWSAADGSLTLDTVTEYSDVQLALEADGGLTPIPGGSFNEVDVDAMTGTASYDCTDTRLELTADGFPTRWDRVG